MARVGYRQELREPVPNGAGSFLLRFWVRDEALAAIFNGLVLSPPDFPKASFLKPGQLVHDRFAVIAKAQIEFTCVKDLKLSLSGRG